MNNEFVRKYCEHYNLEIIQGVVKNYIVDGDTLVGEFKDEDTLVSFCQECGTSKSTMRKGDLLMCIIEDLKLH